MSLRELDRWVAVGISTGLARESVQRAKVGDHDLAVWRGSDGQVRAWQNRCPHRGMRLSFGFVRGTRLTCLYHGWSYDGDGRCAIIPAHPRLTPPKTIEVGRYAIIEHAGLIWVASASQTPEPPAITGDWHACRSISIDASPDHVVDMLSKAAVQPFDSPGRRIDAVKIGEPWAVSDGISQTWLGLIRSEVADAAVGQSLLCAIQPVADSGIMLHIAIMGGGAVAPVVRRHYSDWVKRLRREIESGNPQSIAAPQSTKRTTLREVESVSP
jgi:nitrite reductase/ring-hydroxylating ferredoxin subunit